MPATLWAVKDAVYMRVLSAATAATVVAGPSDDWVQLLLWGGIGIGCFIASAALLRSLRPNSRNR